MGMITARLIPLSDKETDKLWNEIINSEQFNKQFPEYIPKKSWYQKNKKSIPMWIFINYLYFIFGIILGLVFQI